MSLTFVEGAREGAKSEFLSKIKSRIGHRNTNGVDGSSQQISSSTGKKSGDLTAIVIGGGPAGLATSLALSNVCKKVCLVEKNESFDRRGATFGMAVNGQKTLDELSPGLLDDMKSIGLNGGPGNSLVFVWWEMRDTLLNHVQKRRNVRIYTGREFTSINQENNDEVIVQFKSGESIKGDFLVGADGVHSQCRKVLQLPELIISDTTNFRGSIQVPNSASPALKALLDGGMVPLYVSSGKDLYFVSFNFHERHPGRLAWILATQVNVHDNQDISIFDIVRDNVKDESQLELVEEILCLSEKSHLEPYRRSSLVDFSENAVASVGWGGRGLITLVGDAAHAMRPTDGYGGSMALEDAVVLGRVIGSASKPLTTTSIPHLLRNFESERLPRVQKVWQNQFDRYNLRMTQGKHPGPQEAEFLVWLQSAV